MIALSLTETEYSDLSMYLRDVIPLMNLVKEILFEVEPRKSRFNDKI